MQEVIILAAGQGSRMQSSLPKVLHTLAGQPLVAHVLQTARALDADRIHVVVGHGAEAVAASSLTQLLNPHGRHGRGCPSPGWHRQHGSGEPHKHTPGPGETTFNYYFLTPIL